MTLRELILKDMARYDDIVSAADMARTLCRLGPSVRRTMNEMVAEGSLVRNSEGYALPKAAPVVEFPSRAEREANAPDFCNPEADVADPMGDPLYDGEPLVDDEDPSDVNDD